MTTKISILACKKTGDRCTGAGCMKAVNSKTKAFSHYKDEVELLAFWRCNGCDHFIEEDEGLMKKANRIVELKVEYLHISHCCKKKDTKEPCKEILGIAEYLRKNGIEIIEGTH